MYDDDVFVGNYFYKCVYYASSAFGTGMTINSKTNKVLAYTISSLWCLAVVGNQIDYVIKPWMDERKEIRKQDMAFEKIILLDFWTYNLIYFLSCLLPLAGRKIDVNASETSKNLMSDAWRTVVVFLFIAGNLMPAYFSYNFESIQKKTESAYNILLQDICKLGILTVDLQFAWFCWSLKDRFSKLNDDLLKIIALEMPVAKARKRTAATTTTDNSYENDICRANVAYGMLMDSVKAVNGVCEERVLMNVLCYMFNTICGLFNTISAYRTPGTPLLLVVVHLLWVVNCAGRITLVCFAASSVVEQDDRLHDSAKIAEETLGAKSNCSEMNQLLRRLTYCKVKFEFCGMVTIDKTLLSSAVIIVISYLVIVLQYNYS